MAFLRKRRKALGALSIVVKVVMQNRKILTMDEDRLIEEIS